MDASVFREYANMRIELTKQAHGVDLSFDEESILKLDELIEDFRNELQADDSLDLTPEALEGMIVLYGSFLGEVMVENLGAKWGETENGWGVQIGDATANVFSKIKKRILNGMEDSLAYYYQMLKKMSENNFEDISK